MASAHDSNCAVACDGIKAGKVIENSKLPSQAPPARPSSDFPLSRVANGEALWATATESGSGRAKEMKRRRPAAFAGLRAGNLCKRS